MDKNLYDEMQTTLGYSYVWSLIGEFIIAMPLHFLIYLFCTRFLNIVQNTIDVVIDKNN